MKILHFGMQLSQLCVIISQVVVGFKLIYDAVVMSSFESCEISKTRGMMSINLYSTIQFLVYLIESHDVCTALLIPMGTLQPVLYLGYQKLEQEFTAARLFR